jgi:signal transduction histidine kinase
MARLTKLRKQKGYWMTTASGTEIYFGIVAVHCSLKVTNPDLATHVFRIAQEAINNSLRHSQARHIRIAVSVESDFVILTVEGDGMESRSRPVE